jgi:hypothetical protein
LTGCIVSSTRLGTIRPSREVEQSFGALEVVPGCKYYYTGSYTNPEAIIGINNEYNLKSRYWTGVEISSAHIRTWVEGIAESKGLAMSLYGGKIFAPNGNQIGIWYSPYDLARVEMLDETTVRIHQPMSLTPYFLNGGDRRRDD